MKLTDLTVEKFISTTASVEPVPGGGSVSALCGALSAALAQMVARLTIGRKKYAEVQDCMLECIERLEPLCPRLLEAVDLDSQAYDMVFRAYKLPKDTDDEKKARTDAIQKALKHAAEVPLEVAATACSIFADLAVLVEKGNSNAVTDAYVAALCARTAVLGACANVRINLMSITDEKFVDDTIRRVLALEHDAVSKEKCIADAVMKQI